MSFSLPIGKTEACKESIDRAMGCFFRVADVVKFEIDNNLLPVEDTTLIEETETPSMASNEKWEMERSDTTVIEAVRTKLRELATEIERDYQLGFDARWDQWHQVASPEIVESQISSFLEMVERYVIHKARSMQMRAFELFSDMNSNENVRNGVEEFILTFFDDSDDSFYVKDCKMKN